MVIFVQFLLQIILAGIGLDNNQSNDNNIITMMILTTESYVVFSL